MTPAHYSAGVIIILYTGLANEVVPLTGDVRARLSPGLKEQLLLRRGYFPLLMLFRISEARKVFVYVNGGRDAA